MAASSFFALLDDIATTLIFEDEDAPDFDWDGAKAALTHLSSQHAVSSERGQVLLWAAKGRDSSRKPSLGSHSVYIETPDSPKTEGLLGTVHAIDTPILFLLRQDGRAAQGWRGWPTSTLMPITPMGSR